MAERKAYLLRIDPDLWAQVERLELRSANGQVEYLLREAHAKHGIPGHPAAKKPRKT